MFDDEITIRLDCLRLAQTELLSGRISEKQVVGRADELARFVLTGETGKTGRTGAAGGEAQADISSDGSRERFG